MLYGRTARFSPRTQFAILIALQAAMAWLCWHFTYTHVDPKAVEAWELFVGVLLFSLAAEPFGVMIALALSRKNDT